MYLTHVKSIVFQARQAKASMHNIYMCGTSGIGHVTCQRESWGEQWYATTGPLKLCGGRLRGWVVSAAG
jgi:hypothetical protein